MSNRGAAEDNEIEEQMILRVPQHIAVELRKMINEAQDKNARGFDKRVAFALDTAPYGGATFAFGKKKYAATLVNLPTIVESHKTQDHGNYYKTADIGQMFIVHDMEKGKGRPRVYMDEGGTVNNGLCPPFKGIKKRFRRPYPHKEEVTEVESDLARIRGGGDYGNVNIEVVEEDEEEHHAQRRPKTQRKRKAEEVVEEEGRGEEKPKKKRKHKKRKKDEKEEKDGEEKGKKERKKRHAENKEQQTPKPRHRSKDAASAKSKAASSTKARRSGAHVMDSVNGGHTTATMEIDLALELENTLNDNLADVDVDLENDTEPPLLASSEAVIGGVTATPARTSSAAITITNMPPLMSPPTLTPRALTPQVHVTPSGYTPMSPPPARPSPISPPQPSSLSPYSEPSERALPLSPQQEYQPLSPPPPLQVPESTATVTLSPQVPEISPEQAEKKAKYEELQAKEAAIRAEINAAKKSMSTAQENAGRSVNLVVKTRFEKQAETYQKKANEREQALAELLSEMSLLAAEIGM